MSGPPGLYEQEALWKVTGEVVRPGGLEMTDRLVELCGFRAGDRVLDAGCGAGAAVERLRSRGLKALGIDPSEVLLEKARRRFRNKDDLLEPEASFSPPFARAAAEALPFPDACLQGVLCECVLSLTDSMEGALKELHRVLAPGGSLGVTDVYASLPRDPAREPPWPVRCCLQGAVTRREVEAKMRQAAFEVLVWEDRTQALKELAARLVWAFGSLEGFWNSVCPEPGETGLTRRASEGRPGYYLLVARKVGSDF